MLYLIQRNRLGKNIINTEENPVNWRELFKGSEDSLTSSVFSLLFYLPVEIFWQILQKACYGSLLPGQTGKLISYEFWPHWRCTDTKNINFIEPDIFIRFEGFDLIIEAKRNDYKQQQNPQQWRDEITSYNNEFAKCERKPLYLIALAGILNGLKYLEPIETVTVVACRWNRILHQVKQIVENIKKSNYSITNVDSTVNILNDIVRAFAIHGFRTTELLGNLPTKYSIIYQSEITL